MKRHIGGACAVLVLLLGRPATAAEIACNRECLAGFMTTYIDALVKHDPASLPTTRNVKYTENGVRLALGDGLWQTAAAPPTYRVDVIDEHSGQVGLLGRISENGNNNWYRGAPEGGAGQAGLRDRDAGRTAAFRAAVRRRGAATARIPTEPHPLMMQPIPADQRLRRDQLADISDAYFTGLDTENSGRNVPFDPACQRRENGMTMASNPDAEKGSMMWLDCKTQFDTGFSVIVTDIRERRFEVVDPVTGLAFGWGYFDHNGSVPKFTNRIGGPLVDVAPTFRQPFSFYIAEVFKVVDGRIRQIEAVLTTVPYQMESGW